MAAWWGYRNVVVQNEKLHVYPRGKKWSVHVYVCLAKEKKEMYTRVSVSGRTVKNTMYTCMSVWPKGKKWSVHVCVSVQPKSKKWSVHVYVCLSEEEKMNCTHVRMGIQKINFDWFNSFTPVMYAHVWPKAVTKIQKWSPQFLHHAVKSASTNIGDMAILISPSDQASKNTSSSTLK